MCAYPKLIAAYHVLHRLLMPRHSPCALCSLTYLPFVINFALLCRLPHSGTHVLDTFRSSFVVSSYCSFLTKAFSNYLYSYLSFYYLSNNKITKLFTKNIFGLLLFIFMCNFQRTMVGLNGLEPSTSRLSGVRSNQLSYRPIILKDNPSKLNRS